MHPAPSAALTTPASDASADREKVLPAKLGVSVTRSVHSAQLRPSPAKPTGQGPHVDTLVQDTPAWQNHNAPQPAGGGGVGGGGGGSGGVGGAGSAVTTGHVVSFTPVTEMPALCSAATETPPVVAILPDTKVAAEALSTNTW